MTKKQFIRKIQSYKGRRAQLALEAADRIDEYDIRWNSVDENDLIASFAKTFNISLLEEVYLPENNYEAKLVLESNDSRIEVEEYNSNAMFSALLEEAYRPEYFEAKRALKPKENECNFYKIVWLNLLIFLQVCVQNATA